MVLVMLVAIFSSHIKKGYWSTSGGYEYKLLIIAAALALALTGAGPLSIDAILFT